MPITTLRAILDALARAGRLDLADTLIDVLARTGKLPRRRKRRVVYRVGQRAAAS